MYKKGVENFLKRYFFRYEANTGMVSRVNGISIGPRLAFITLLLLAQLVRNVYQLNLR